MHPRRRPIGIVRFPLAHAPPRWATEAMAIRVLPQTLINQIAAGEVIARMASVAKELVDNSIDAGASRVEVALSGDARSIEVRDDGAGMGRDDAEMSLQRHATSKIASLSDLVELATRGFRGEALASIAAVARMELQTRRREDLDGTRIVVEGGVIHRIEPVGCPPGTRIVVRELFYNTPARLKFLKSANAESQLVATILTRLALAASEVGMTFLRDDDEQFSHPPGQRLEERFASILGGALTAPLVSIGHQRGEVSISGAIAPPSCTRGDRRHQFLFVNGRPFSSRTLTASLEQAFRGHIMVQRYPIAAVMISLPPAEVDFNVHPAKEEVRFRDEREVAGAVYRAVEAAVVEGAGRGISLGGAIAAGAVDAPEPSAPLPGFFRTPEAFAARGMGGGGRGSQRDWVAEAKRLGVGSQNPGPTPAHSGPPVVLRHSDESVISAGPGEVPDPEFWSDPHEVEVLGQVAETYIVARHGTDLLVVDQHAAHERLVYLRLARRAATLERQTLLVPVPVEFPTGLAGVVESALPILAELGFDLERSGARTWAAREVPADLEGADISSLLLDLVSDIEAGAPDDSLARRRDRILIRAACHSAIRAGQPLGMPQMAELIDQMRRERLSFCCPHGRPTIVRVGRGELERWFKRVV